MSIATIDMEVQELERAPRVPFLPTTLASNLLGQIFTLLKMGQRRPSPSVMATPSN